MQSGAAQPAKQGIGTSLDQPNDINKQGMLMHAKSTKGNDNMSDNKEASINDLASEQPYKGSVTNSANKGASTHDHAGKQPPKTKQKQPCGPRKASAGQSIIDIDFGVTATKELNELDDEPYFDEDFTPGELVELEAPNNEDKEDTIPTGKVESAARQAARLVGGKKKTQTAFLRLKRTLNMDPSAEHIARTQSEVEKQRCRETCRLRITILITALKQQVELDKDKGKFGALSTGFYRLIRKTSVEWMVNTILRGLRDEVQVVLGLDDITVEDILSISSAEAANVYVDSWGVYINIIIQEDGEIFVYVGSGTAQDSIKARLDSYASAIRSEKTFNSAHVTRMKSAETVPYFRILSLYNKHEESSVITSLLSEGVLALFFKSVSNSARSRTGKAMISPATMSLCEENGFMLGLTPLNGVLPIRQGLTYVRVYGYSRFCDFPLCGKEIAKGSPALGCMTENGYTMRHVTCGRASIVQDQILMCKKAGLSNACAVCNARGLAETCSREAVCNHCLEWSESSHHWCKFDNSGSRLITIDGEIKQINEVRCWMCIRHDDQCHGGSAPDGDKPGVKCKRCQDTQACCTLAGQVPQAMRIPNPTRCQQCKNRDVPCYGGGDGVKCNTCKSNKYYKCEEVVDGPVQVPQDLITLWAIYDAEHSGPNETPKIRKRKRPLKGDVAPGKGGSAPVSSDEASKGEDEPEH